MKSLSRYLLGLLWVTTCTVPLTACALSGEAINGKVLEDGTNKPITGAMVVARWQGHLATFAHGKTVCYHVLSTTSDEHGRYRFPAWRKAISEDWQRNIRPEDVLIAAYKLGYQWSQRHEEGVQYLTPFSGGPGERFQYLSRVISGTSCGSAGTSYKNLYRLRHAVYEEALSVARTAGERKHAERFKEIAEGTLVDRSKPTTYDERGRLINVDPKDTLRPEDMK